MLRKILISFCFLLLVFTPVWAVEMAGDAEDLVPVSNDNNTGPEAYGIEDGTLSADGSEIYIDGEWVSTENDGPEAHMTPTAAQKAKLIPPKLIGGELLPGTEEEIQKEIEEDATGWLQNTFLKNLIDNAIGWTAALAVLFLIIGGYQYLTAAGDEEKIKNAHKAITFSLVGLLLALLAFAIVQIVVNIQFSDTEARLLAADVKDILPFAEEEWEGGVKEIENLPKADFKEEFLPIIARLLIYGMASVAFLVFLFAGAYLVVGWGEEASVKKAKDTITWAITGLAFAAVSYILVRGMLGIDLSF